MSQEDETTHQTENLSGDSEQALSALRGIWSAKDQTSAQIDEACGNTKPCKNMETVGFHGLVDEDDTPSKSVGNNLRTAWKRQLERDGKLPTGGSSVKDLVFGSPDPNKE
ncbi:MAG: hypothetical protein ACRDSP_02810 [Pseudonocardiaceae bacterium]